LVCSPHRPSVYLENYKGRSACSFEFTRITDGMYGFGGNWPDAQHLWYLEILFILSLLFLALHWLRYNATGQRVLKGVVTFWHYQEPFFIHPANNLVDLR
jgi:hypothetical protein